MYALFPYMWLLFMFGLVVSVVVVAVMSGSKEKPARRKKKEVETAAADPLADSAEPALDFGDELAQMEK